MDRRKHAGFCFPVIIETMRWNRVVGLVIAGVSLLGILVTSLPVPRQKNTIPFNDGQNLQGTLLVDLPAWMKIGDTAVVSLQVKYSPSQAESVNPKKLDLIDRLEIGFLDVSPRGEGHVSINPDSAITLKWQVRPFYEAHFSGTLWLFQQYPGQKSQLILGRVINLPAKKFLGISFRLARTIACAGLILAVVFYFLFSITLFKKKI
jgi:hypothetical protein